MNKVTSDLWVARCHGKEREFAVPHVWLCAQAETSLARAAEITRQPREKKRLMLWQQLSDKQTHAYISS